MKSPFLYMPGNVTHLVLALTICGGASTYKGLLLILGCSRNTLERAMSRAKEEGFVTTIPWKREYKTGRARIAIVLTTKTKHLLKKIGL